MYSDGESYDDIIYAEFVNCIGSDISLWKKGPHNESYVHESFLLYDEPRYPLSIEDNYTTWKFFSHITKMYLLGNGEKEFHFQITDADKKRKIDIEIKTPLYTLKELCLQTIATRLYCNNQGTDELKIPDMLKNIIQSSIEELNTIQEKTGGLEEFYDWTTSYEKEYEQNHI